MSKWLYSSDLDLDSSSTNIVLSLHLTNFKSSFGRLNSQQTKWGMRDLPLLLLLLLLWFLSLSLSQIKANLFFLKLVAYFALPVPVFSLLLRPTNIEQQPDFVG